MSSPRGLSRDAKIRNVAALPRGQEIIREMRIDQAVNIEDLHRMAKRRLPKIAFDFIEGGLEDERGLERNTSAFHTHQLLPRYLVDVSKRDQSATLFGRTYASPFGISPTGGAGLFRRGGDLMLAQAAAEANIPYIMSGASNDSIEAAARVAPKNTWYQLYAATDAKVREDMIRRTADAGLDALVLTVDVPVSSKRERNIRNGFANVRGGLLQALSLKPSILIESLTHPGWIVEYLRYGGGTPMLQNWQPYASNGANAEAVYNFSRSLLPYNAQTWRDLEHYRRLFPRNLVVKGIMGPARCVALRRDRLRRHHRLQPRRPRARPSSRLARRIARNPRGGRRQAHSDARQRRAARRRYPDRTLPRRAVLLHGPADALWRRGRRHPGRQKGDLDLPRRERSRDGPDRLPQPRPARPRFPVARRSGAQCVTVGPSQDAVCFTSGLLSSPRKRGSRGDHYSPRRSWIPAFAGMTSGVQGISRRHE
jgi:isopentenyl diphosphate isomerase/L-lactate dehydrogenase-like FMN-dependent dehydrogenase